MEGRVKICLFINPVQNLDCKRKINIQINKDQFQFYNDITVLALLLKVIPKKKVAHLTPCIMCVQYRGGCSVPWGVFSTVGGYLEYRGGVQYRGGYHEYRGGLS